MTQQPPRRSAVPPRMSVHAVACSAQHLDPCFLQDRERIALARRVERRDDAAAGLRIDVEIRREAALPARMTDDARCCVIQQKERVADVAMTVLERQLWPPHLLQGR